MYFPYVITIDLLKCFMFNGIELWIADGVEVDRKYLLGKYVKRMIVIMGVDE